MASSDFLPPEQNPIAEVNLPGLGECQRGKVRDAYMLDQQRRLLITTDRVSAFDRVVGIIPYKGQVLNQLTNWWFEQCRDVVANHLIETPHPNVAVVRNAKPLPVEIVVRGYITGVTKTALWTLYSEGVERPYGLDLPAGLEKNDRLPEPVITPTTKAGPGEKDERLTCQEVLDKGLVGPELWKQVQAVALTLFRRGQARAAASGLILVDTKYEFGLVDGELTLIDEVHTPDSSRYWIAGSEGDEKPRHLDKEVLRLWLAETGFRGDGDPPVLPPARARELAQTYGEVYHRLTGSRIQAAVETVESAVEKLVGTPV